MEPKVSIIILNWNGWKDTIKCLESLFKVSYPNYNVILIDNNSTDNSIKMIRQYCTNKLKFKEKVYFNAKESAKLWEYFIGEVNNLNPKKNSSHLKFTIIKNDRNYGFAEGNNIGMRYALKNLDPNYILLLNNDTVVDKEFLNEMIKAIKNKQEIGFVGPKVYYYNYNGRRDIINFAGGRLNLLKGSTRHIGIAESDRRQYDQIKKVDYVEGSCILIKREVLEKVGLMDTRYFAYWEENDLCMRGLKQNYFCLYVPKAKIWHKVSCSSKGTIKIYYLTRNRFWFTKKYAKKSQYTFFIAYFFLFEFWFKCVSIVYHRNKTAIKPFIKGIKDGLIHEKITSKE